jgi:hypothetical protein
MMKKILVTGLIILICFTGLAIADTGMPQVPETQGFSTATAISTFGTVTETDSIVSQMINCGACGLPVPLPLIVFDHVVYTSAYSENTIADQGFVTIAKTITADTAGMATENQFNVKTNRIVEFIGSNTGRMVSGENTLLDGVGTLFDTENIMLCPFAGNPEYITPAFCNIVEEGSNADLTIGSLTTATEERHIMLSASGNDPEDPPWQFPVSGPGVEMNYNIRITGFGDIPATGSAEAYMNVHIQEGSTTEPYSLDNGYIKMPKIEDLVYSETSTATGDITLFDKTMNYHSKITGTAVCPELPVIPVV